MYIELLPASDYEIGDKTVFAKGSYFDYVKLHAEFSYWGGGDLQTSRKSVICTSRLKLELGKLQMSGASFADVEVTLTEDFENDSEGKEFPEWHWLRISGEAYVDDLGFAVSGGMLVVSQRVFTVLETIDVNYAESMVKSAAFYKKQWKNR